MLRYSRPLALMRRRLKITKGKADLAGDPVEGCAKTFDQEATRPQSGLPGASRGLCRRRLRFRSRLQKEASRFPAALRKFGFEPVSELPAFDLEARNSSIEVIGLRKNDMSPGSPATL